MKIEVTITNDFSIPRGMIEVRNSKNFVLAVWRVRGDDLWWSPRLHLRTHIKSGYRWDFWTGNRLEISDSFEQLEAAQKKEVMDGIEKKKKKLFLQCKDLWREKKERVRLAKAEETRRIRESF